MSHAAEDAPLAPARDVGGLLGKLPKELWWALLELFALTGLAIAQPLLDVTGKAPDFFLYHRAGRNQILAVIALVVEPIIKSVSGVTGSFLPLSFRPKPFS